MSSHKLFLCILSVLIFSAKAEEVIYVSDLMQSHRMTLHDSHKNAKAKTIFVYDMPEQIESLCVVRVLEYEARFLQASNSFQVIDKASYSLAKKYHDEAVSNILCESLDLTAASFEVESGINKKTLLSLIDYIEHKISNQEVTNITFKSSELKSSFFRFKQSDLVSVSSIDSNKYLLEFLDFDSFIKVIVDLDYPHKITVTY